MNWKDKRLLPVAIIVTGLSVFGYLKLTHPQQPPIQAKERIWYVDTVTAQPQHLSPSLILYGQVETPDLMKGAAPSNSRVDQIFVREGDRVTEGQLLLKLDPRDFEPQVVQEEAQVAELEAMMASERLRHASNKKAIEHEKSLLQLNKAAVERAKKMKAKNLGSMAALDQARQELERQALALTERKLSLDDHKARLQQLAARLKRAQANLDTAHLNLERSQIQAPFTGYISEINVATGDQVNSNQHLLSLYPIDTLEVRAIIPGPYQRELQNALSDENSLLAHTNYGNVTSERRQALALTERKLSLDDHKARLQQLAARLKRAQANLDTAHLNLERSQIQAPFTGYISEINVATGDQVNSNQHLLSLYPIDTLEVRAIIPGPYQRELQNALSDENSLLAHADYGNTPVVLQLDRLSGAAEPRGIDALFKLVQGADGVRIGSSLSLNLLRPPQDNAVALPYTALYGRDKVYRLIDGRMQGTRINHLGDYIDDAGNSSLLITGELLKAGDQVIITHLPNAINGLRVEPRQVPTQQTSAAQN